MRQKQTITLFNKNPRCESCLLNCIWLNKLSKNKYRCELNWKNKHHKEIIKEDNHVCFSCKKKLPDQPAGWYWFCDGWAYDVFGDQKHCKKCLMEGKGSPGLL